MAPVARPVLESLLDPTAPLAQTSSSRAWVEGGKLRLCLLLTRGRPIAPPIYVHPSTVRLVTPLTVFVWYRGMRDVLLSRDEAALAMPSLLSRPADGEGPQTPATGTETGMGGDAGGMTSATTGDGEGGGVAVGGGSGTAGDGGGVRAPCDWILRTFVHPAVMTKRSRWKVVEMPTLIGPYTRHPPSPTSPSPSTPVTKTERAMVAEEMEAAGPDACAQGVLASPMPPDEPPVRFVCSTPDDLIRFDLARRRRRGGDRAGGDGEW